MESIKIKKARAAHDSAWKDVIDAYLPEAIQFTAVPF